MSQTLCFARRGRERVAMKRFPSEGSNAQERRQLMRTQSDGEETTGLAAPAKAVVGLGGGHFLGHSDYITLECLGDKPGPRYLDGRTHNGTVGLAPHTNPPYTGTRWRVHYLKPSADNQQYWIYDHIFLYCEGTGPGDYRYLDGRTHNGTVGSPRIPTRRTREQDGTLRRIAVMSKIRTLLGTS